MAPVVFGYWNLRARANPHRLLLHYAGVSFEDKKYELTDPNEWLAKDKVRLQETMDFPNMPYYVDEDVQLSQTHVILPYLGRKHGLDGKNEMEKIRIDLAIEQARDLFDPIVKIAYPPGNPFCGYQIDNMAEIHEKERKVYASLLPGRLAAMSKFLGAKDWVAGDRLTYADFYVYDVLDFNRLLFDPKHLNAFPNLVAYMKRFEGLKGVKEFMASNDYIHMPIWTPFACFGHTVDYKPTE